MHPFPQRNLVNPSPRRPAAPPKPGLRAVGGIVLALLTFWAIASFLLGQTLNVFLIVAAVYGFTTAAMLVPAVYEFDVATGRTSAEG